MARGGGRLRGAFRGQRPGTLWGREFGMVTAGRGQEGHGELGFQCPGVTALPALGDRSGGSV